MIRVHVLHVLVPRSETVSGVRYSRLDVGRDESIRPDRVDSLFHVTPDLRRHNSFGAEARTCLRYDDASNDFGHRVLVLSDSLDAVERMIVRAFRGGGGDFDSDIPAYLPEDL